MDFYNSNSGKVCLKVLDNKGTRVGQSYVQSLVSVELAVGSTFTLMICT